MALEFTILTAARTAEVIGAKWSEIDLDAGVWSINASRMKAKKPHIVPLSPRAIAILSALPRTGEHVFLKWRRSAFSNQAMSELLKGMVPPERATVHGFRSSFSDWAHDRANVAPDVIEHALAHTIKNKTAAAYRRQTAIDKRVQLMAAWSKFCEAPAVTGENVVAIRG